MTHLSCVLKALRNLPASPQHYFPGILRSSGALLHTPGTPPPKIKVLKKLPVTNRPWFACSCTSIPKFICVHASLWEITFTVCTRSQSLQPTERGRAVTDPTKRHKRWHHKWDAITALAAEVSDHFTTWKHCTQALHPDKDVNYCWEFYVYASAIFMQKA